MSISAGAISELPLGSIAGLSQLYRMQQVNLTWLADVKPQVHLPPPEPETRRLDDPSPSVHDTSRFA